MPVWVYAVVVAGLAWFETWGVLALFAGYMVAGWWGVILTFALVFHMWDIAEAAQADAEEGAS